MTTAIEVLRSLEWSGTSDRHEENECPCCYSLKGTNHTPNCRLDCVLKNAAPSPVPPYRTRVQLGSFDGVLDALKETVDQLETVLQPREPALHRLSFEVDAAHWLEVVRDELQRMFREEHPHPDGGIEANGRKQMKDAIVSLLEGDLYTQAGVHEQRILRHVIGQVKAFSCGTEEEITACAGCGVPGFGPGQQSGAGAALHWKVRGAWVCIDCHKTATAICTCPDAATVGNAKGPRIHFSCTTCGGIRSAPIGDR